jgi:predicted nuclease with RNAse H fold
MPPRRCGANVKPKTRGSGSRGTESSIQIADKLYRVGAKALHVHPRDSLHRHSHPRQRRRRAILRPFVRHVVVANPRMVRAIAYARVKTDKIDSAILARLYAGGFLPGSGSRTTTPNASVVRPLSAWTFSNRWFARRDAFT